MTSKAKLLLLACAAAPATVTAVAAATLSTPSVTITTPKTNSTVELHKTPYLAVAGTAAFAAANSGSSRFFLRRDGCGTSNDNPHLSTTVGNPDGGDGCGLVFNAVVGLGGDADQGAFVDFPASDSMPVALDATRAITGAISLTGGQIGIAQVDVTLEALVGGEAVTLGTASGSAVMDPTADHTPVPFSIQPAATLNGADIQALDLRVHIHGPNVYSGFISLNGNSYADVPNYAASINRSVQVSVDDATFANAVPARLDASAATWSVAIQTPAVGKHTIYARGTQGFETSASAATTITVKK